MEPVVSKLNTAEMANCRNPAAAVMPMVHGNKAYLFVKRSFDILWAVIVGIILLIPMLIIAAMIRLDSPGPVIFKQERLGENGKPFMIYKFRSMQLNAEENGPQWAEKDDKRGTRLGRLLRQTHLDELPQVLNILTGDMSLVGPRPERACFYDDFETYIPGFRNRLLVKPGLTGYAQVNGGYDLMPEEKIVFDMEYIRTRTLWWDLKLIVQTVRLVVTHEGAR